MLHATVRETVDFVEGVENRSRNVAGGEVAAISRSGFSRDAEMTPRRKAAVAKEREVQRKGGEYIRNGSDLQQAASPLLLWPSLCSDSELQSCGSWFAC